MSQAFKIEGTVLSKRAFGESDAMLDVLTVSRGLQTVVAKGAYRSRRRLVGGLEPFTRTIFTLYESRPGRLPVVQDLKVVKSRFELYRDYDRFNRLAEVSAFLTQHLPPGVPEYEIHDLVESLLAALLAGGRTESLILSFYLRAFSMLGWKMDVGACAACKKIPSIEGPYELDFSEGRIFCPACRRGSPVAGSVVILDLATSHGLSGLILSPRLRAGISIDPACETALRRLIDRYLLWHTGGDIPRDAPALRAV